MKLHPLLFNRLLVLVFLLVGLLGYFIAEDSLILRVLSFCLTLTGIFFLLLRRRIAFPVLLAFYLGVVSLTDWYFVSSAPLLLLIGLVTLLELLLGYAFLTNEGIRPRHPAATYLIVALLGLEVLLIYSFYLVSPSAIALLMLVYFYAMWGLTMLYEEKTLSLKAASPYLGLAVLFTVLTLLSSGVVK